MKKLYHVLYTCFYYETFIYELPLTKAQIIERLNVLFKEKTGIFQAPNLCGSFSGADSFTMTPKWSFFMVKGLSSNDPSILKGVIANTDRNKTRIEVAVRANSVGLILFIFFLIFGITQLVIALMHPGNNNILTAFLILAVPLPLITWLASFASRSVRKSFEKYFEVEPLEISGTA